MWLHLWINLDHWEASQTSLAKAWTGLFTDMLCYAAEQNYSTGGSSPSGPELHDLTAPPHLPWIMPALYFPTLILSLLPYFIYFLPSAITTFCFSTIKWFWWTTIFSFMHHICQTERGNHWSLNACWFLGFRLTLPDCATVLNQRMSHENHVECLYI